MTATRLAAAPIVNTTRIPIQPGEVATAARVARGCRTTPVMREKVPPDRIEGTAAPGSEVTQPPRYGECAVLFQVRAVARSTLRSVVNTRKAEELPSIPPYVRPCAPAPVHRRRVVEVLRLPLPGHRHRPDALY